MNEILKKWMNPHLIEEMEEGVAAVPESLKKAIRQAIDNIRKFHASQAIEVKKVETSPGV